MRHPEETQLALFAGGELGFWSRWPLSKHVAQCPDCTAKVQSFRDLREQLRDEAAELPRNLNWDRLAAEMTANIHVGLAASECISRSPKPMRIASHGAIWKPAVAVAGLLLIVASRWWLGFPAEDRHALANAVHKLWAPQPVKPELLAPDSGVALEANQDGLQVVQNGASLTLMQTGSKPSLVSASTQGSVRARYIDADTGQVTITNVYVGQ